MPAVPEPSGDGRLPEEVWTRIIRLVPEGYGSTQAVVDYLTVSRAWRDMVEPVLFEAVVIISDQRLHQFAARLLRERRPGQTTSVGDWVHDLQVNIPSISSWDFHMNSLFVILMHAHCIHAFRYHTLPIRTSQLLCITHVAGSRLRTLLVNINASGEACLPLLAQMECLEELLLFFDTNQPPSLAQTHPISMPSVRRLVLHWHASLSPASSRFLFSSTFKNATDLEICVSRLTEEYFQSFIAFVTDRTQALQHLSLDIPRETIAAVRGSLIGYTERLNFLKCVPEPAFLDSWARTSTLRHLSVRTTQSGDDLWPFLSNLASSGSRRFEDSNFVIRPQRSNSADDRFTWDSGTRSSDMAAFIGRLLHHVRALRRMGITMHDENGLLFDEYGTGL